MMAHDCVRLYDSMLHCCLAACVKVLLSLLSLSPTYASLFPKSTLYALVGGD